jgi:phosphopantetheine adenylyltransferase
VANYNVDIAVALKGAKQLTSFNREVKATTTNIDAFAKQLRSAAKDQGLLVKSFDNLNQVLSKAKSNFNAAASGTSLQEKAARQLVLAEKQLNKEYKQREKLLNNLRTSFTPMPLPGSGVGSDPVAKSIKRRRRKLAGNPQAYSSPVGPFQASQLEMIPGFGMGSLQGQSSPVGDRIAKALENEKKLVKDVEAIRGRASKKRAANTKRQLSLEKRSNAFVKKAIKEETALRKKAEAEANKLAEKRRARRQKLGSTASSAIIGGAFPLLFGQTGAAAVGGGIGGAAGGLIGGQFGFALSILGTAIGSAIDKNEKFRQSLAVLNVQFSATSGGTQILAADVDKLAKRLSVTKEEAIAALSAFREFGSGSVAKSLVSIFGTDSGAFDTLAATNRQAALAQQIFQARKQIGNQVAKQLLQQNLINDSSTIELALAEAKAKAANDEAIAKAKVVTFTDQLAASAAAQVGRPVDVNIFGEERAQKIQEEFDKNRSKRLEDFKNSLKEVRELLGLVNEANGQFGQSGVLAFSAINDKVKNLQDEMKMLQDPIRLAINLSDVMGASFEESFKGIIKGTMTVADAFRSMLNRIADVFLDTAARMLANQFQQGILGLFGNLFGGFNAFNSVGDPAITGAFSSSGSSIPFVVPNTPLVPGLANGGMAKGGKSYLVGERGPELFTPGVSGMVTPNHQLGGMGGTNIVVNVDASGSNVEGDEDEGRALGVALSAAIESELIKQKRPGGLLA